MHPKLILRNISEHTAFGNQSKYCRNPNTRNQNKCCRFKISINSFINS